MSRTRITPTTNDFSENALDKLPTLAVGQCCSLKIDTFPVRVWLCRSGQGVTIETYNPTAGRYEITQGGCYSERTR